MNNTFKKSISSQKGSERDISLTKIVVDIEATKIDLNHICFDCPLGCMKSIHSIKKKEHLHNSFRNLDNRIEHRIGHCKRNESIIFKIHITDFTERV